MLLRAKADLAMDVVNLKISKLGGLTKTKQVRDLCVSMGIAMTLEDSWGGDITTAAIAHLAHSTPGRVPLHQHRLQQLRHRQHGRRCPATRERLHAGLDRTGIGHPPEAGRARPTGRGSAPDRPDRLRRDRRRHDRDAELGPLVARHPRRRWLARVRPALRRGPRPPNHSSPSAACSGRRSSTPNRSRRCGGASDPRPTSPSRRPRPAPGASWFATTPRRGRRRSSSRPRRSCRTGPRSRSRSRRYEFSADESRVLIYTNSQRVWRRNTRGDYWVLDVATREAHEARRGRRPVVADVRHALAGRHAGRLRPREQPVRSGPGQPEDHRR